MDKVVEDLSYNNIPSFFRILLQDFSQKLWIPSAFLKHVMNERLSRKATLVDPNDKSYQVDVYKDIMKGMHFGGDGWVEFLHAHNLGLGYFLVFRYRGNMVFDFRAYDLSTCEIVYPSVAPREGGVVQTLNQEVGRKRTRVEQTRNQADDQKPRRVGRPRKQEADQKPRRVGRPRKQQADQKPGRVGRPRKQEEIRASSMLSSLSALVTDRCNAIQILNQEVDRKRTRFVQTRKQQADQKPRRVSRPRKQEEIRASTSTKRRTCTIKCFEAKITPYNLTRAFMTIPAGVMAEFTELRRQREMILKDPDGRSWNIRVFHNNLRPHTHLSGGWSHFAQGNNLKLGDKCVFELVTKGKGKGKEMVVQIIRRRGRR